MEGTALKWHNHCHRVLTATPVPAGEAGAFTAAGQTWPEFWVLVQERLRARGYRRSSLVVVRQALRGLARACGVPPRLVTREHLDRYFRRSFSELACGKWNSIVSSPIGGDLIIGSGEKPFDV